MGSFGWEFEMGKYVGAPDYSDVQPDTKSTQPQVNGSQDAPPILDFGDGIKKPEDWRSGQVFINVEVEAPPESKNIQIAGSAEGLEDFEDVRLHRNIRKTPEQSRSPEIGVIETLTTSKVQAIPRAPTATPSSKRRSSRVGMKYICKACGLQGHNSRTCGFSKGTPDPPVRQQVGIFEAELYAASNRVKAAEAFLADVKDDKPIEAAVERLEQAVQHYEDVCKMAETRQNLLLGASVVHKKCDK